MLSCFRWKKSAQAASGRATSKAGKAGTQPEVDTDGSSFKPSIFKPAFTETLQRTSWLHINKSGNVSLQEVNSRAAAVQLGVAERDLKLVDPQESPRCPVKLTVRNHTILVCFEGLRLVIAKDQALLLSVPGATSLQEATVPFSDTPSVRDLISRLRISSYPDSGGELVDKSLPFELVVLEWALALTAKMLTEEAVRFEKMATQVLDDITNKISHKRISSMRQVKFGVSDLITRFDRFRQELKDVLDDNSELLRMNLSQRSTAEDSSTHGGMANITTSGAVLAVAPSQRRRKSQVSSGRSRRHDGRRRMQQQPVIIDPGAVAESSSLLECYLIQIEAALNSMRTVSSCSGSTEDMLRLSIKMQRIRLGHC